MAIAKVIEVIASSTSGFEDAVAGGIAAMQTAMAGDCANRDCGSDRLFLPGR